MLKKLKKRWNGPVGYKKILLLAMPLIVSSGSHSIQMFVDRIFLAKLDPNMMSGSVMAGITNWTILSLFVGVASYTNTFVAQYHGAKKYNQIGIAIWQGIFFATFAGLFMVGVSFLSEDIFAFMKHDEKIIPHEIMYFRILTLGAWPMLLSNSLSCFFSGRGKTRVIMITTLIGTTLNVILDYILIFGKFGFPQMGIKGAGIATVAAAVLMSVIYICLVFNSKYRQKYNILPKKYFDRDIFTRLMRFGFPSGLQNTLDMISFMTFGLYVGRLGDVKMNAHMLALQVNLLAFLPMIGMSIAVATLVGQSLGSNDPKKAQTITWRAAQMSFTYMTLLAISFCIIPDLYLNLFKSERNADIFAEMLPIARQLLIFAALISIFDTGSIIMGGALRGAGDTRFVMWMSVAIHWGLLLIPSIIINACGGGLYHYWAFFTLTVCVLAIAFLWRFNNGKWKTMRVIEMDEPVTEGFEPPEYQ
ncbi:MAG: MATE family efflux transporter [Phycisphaerae bacterium]|nr:MATE family efflux transporter [Phycisphaerae bacterium]